MCKFRSRVMYKSNRVTCCARIGYVRNRISAERSIISLPPLSRSLSLAGICILRIVIPRLEITTLAEGGAGDKTGDDFICRVATIVEEALDYMPGGLTKNEKKIRQEGRLENHKRGRGI